MHLFTTRASHSFLRASRASRTPPLRVNRVAFAQAHTLPSASSPDSQKNGPIIPTEIKHRHCGPLDITAKVRTDVYQLPVNDEEISRLNNQHVLLKMLIGGNYIGPVREHLNAREGHPKSILDIGCGTGAWSMDMAAEFPHCSVVGIDVAPMQLRLAPPNLRMEVVDVNHGLKAYDDKFDLINARMIAMGIKNYPSLIGNIAKSLRPGGIIHIQEWDFFKVDTQRNIVRENDSWFSRWCSALRHSIEKRQGSISAANGLEGMIESLGSFSKVHQQNVWIPVGAWNSNDTAEGRHLNLVGDFMREDVKAFIKSGRTLLLSSGMSLEEYKILEHEAIMEVQLVQIPGYLRLNCVWARKN